MGEREQEKTSPRKTAVWLWLNLSPSPYFSFSKLQHRRRISALTFHLCVILYALCSFFSGGILQIYLSFYRVQSQCQYLLLRPFIIIPSCSFLLFFIICTSICYFCRLLFAIFAVNSSTCSSYRILRIAFLCRRRCRPVVVVPLAR